MVLRLLGGGLGGATGPLGMLFSLLLMQGLSLTMFRAFLRNNINPRTDPLRFNFNLGNTNLSSSNPAVSDSGQSNGNSALANGLAGLLSSPAIRSPLSSLIFPVTHVPTPAPPTLAPTAPPIVDHNTIDLITLIRALMPANANQNQNNGGISGSVSAPLVTAPIIAVPVQTHQPLQSAPSSVSQGTPTTQPHIIIVPQLMKTSASDQVTQTVQQKSGNEFKEEDEKVVPETVVPENTNRKEEQDQEEDKIFTRRRKRKNSSKDKMIVFEAVSVDDF